jgi:tRNA-specific 2-thiouridylase
MSEFLKMYIKPKKGKFISIKDNKVLGEHDQAFYYTIGQRHGLDIKDGHGPYFVVKKDIKSNIVYVGTEKDLYSKEAEVKDISWINKPAKFPAIVDVRARYRAPLKKAVLKESGELKFKTRERAITSGQSVVFYKGREVLGGGVIER